MSSFVQSFNSWKMVVADPPLNSALAFHLLMYQSVSMLFFSGRDGQTHHLPLRHTLSRHQNRPNKIIVQHPFVRFRLHSPYPGQQSSITRQFECINTLLVTTMIHGRIHTCGYGKSGGPNEPWCIGWFIDQKHATSLKQYWRAPSSPKFCIYHPLPKLVDLS